MYSESTLHNLLPLIYQAAADPERWSAFLACYQEIIDARNIVLAHLEPDKDRTLIVSTGADQTDIQKYYQYSCPWLDRLMLENWQTGGADASHHLITDAELQSTPCFSEFLGPRQFHYGMGAAIRALGDGPAMMVILREKRKGPYEEEDLAFLRVLVPHMSQAFKLYGRIAALETGRRGLASSLDRLPTGVLILDSAGRVLYGNRAAHNITGRNDGLRIERDGLVAALPRETTALRRLISKVALTTTGNGAAAGGELLLSRPSMSRSLAVSVSPLPKDELFPGLPGTAAVAVFVSDPETTHESGVSLLARLYGLTAAESRLAGALISGDDLRETASALGISYHTARAQVKSIFSKTGTRRQSELVRLLVSLPARSSFQAASSPNGR